MQTYIRPTRFASVTLLASPPFTLLASPPFTLDSHPAHTAPCTCTQDANGNVLGNMAVGRVVDYGLDGFYVSVDARTRTPVLCTHFAGEVLGPGSGRLRCVWTRGLLSFSFPGLSVHSALVSAEPFPTAQPLSHCSAPKSPQHLIRVAAPGAWSHKLLPPSALPSAPHSLTRFSLFAHSFVGLRTRFSLAPLAPPRPPEQRSARLPLQEGKHLVSLKLTATPHTHLKTPHAARCTLHAAPIRNPRRTPVRSNT